MEAKQFVQALKLECKDSAVADCVKNLTSPPGRSPANSLKELSSWFNSLSEADRNAVIRAMDIVADATLFGVLCVLDGVRPIEGVEEKSTFQLIACKGKEKTIISSGQTDLHDLLKSL